MNGKALCLALLTLVTSTARADSVPMRDYGLLSTGMHATEILERIGPYDHETVLYDYHPHNVIKRTWFYYPAPGEYARGRWITEIHFNHHGIVTHLDRYKAWTK